MHVYTKISFLLLLNNDTFLWHWCSNAHSKYFIWSCVMLSAPINSCLIWIINQQCFGAYFTVRKNELFFNVVVVPSVGLLLTTFFCLCFFYTTNTFTHWICKETYVVLRHPVTILVTHFTNPVNFTKDLLILNFLLWICQLAMSS